MLGSTVMPEAVWHPELAVAGLGVGAAAVLATWRRRRWLPAVTAIGAVLALLLAGLAPVAATLGAAAASISLPGRVHTALFQLVGVAALVSGLPDPTGPNGRALAVTGAFVVLASSLGPGRGDTAQWAFLSALLPAALWLCVPDTEQVLLVALAGGLAAASTLARRPRPVGSAPARQEWTGPTLVALWAGARGFTGRPGGLPALFALAWIVGLWFLVSRLRSQRGAPAGRRKRTTVLLAVDVLIAGLGVVVARTAGLDHRADVPPLSVAAFAVLVAVAWWVAAAPQGPQRNCSRT
ncbi:hypothetical protein BH10ACT1_BH10ACT1_07970 [soil metagenome]